MTPRIPVTLALAMALVPALTAARPGDPDPTWSGDGIATTDVGLSDMPSDVAVQADGKVVVVGGAGSQYVVRYRDDGTLDPGFGAGGIVTTTVPGASCGGTTARAVAIDGSGRVLVASNYDCPRVLVARYDGAGVLDPSFGTGGLALVAAGATDKDVVDMLVQPDGKIVLAGYRRLAGNAQIMLMRLDDGGVLDSMFGSGGFVDVDLPLDDEALAVARQPDGKLVVLGLAAGSTVIARCDDTGAIDAGFGIGGILEVPSAQLLSLALAPGGGIVAAGRVFSPPPSFVTMRFEPDGDPDTTFAGTGRVDTSFGGVAGESARAVLVQGDGKVVVVGHTDPTNGVFDLVLIRYHADGARDLSFGTAGIVTTPVGGPSFIDSGGAAIAPDGRLVVAGPAGASPYDFAVYRYLGGTCGDGLLDGGETCDDGDTIASVCCSAVCDAAPAGTSCDEDSVLCYTDDHCDGAGACLHIPGPQPGCKQPIAPASGRLTLKASSPTLVWKWTRGAATTFAELADPLTDDAYALCAYAGPTETPALSAVAPAGGTCGGRPCWMLRGTAGFRYRDRLRSGDGIEKIVLTAGGPGAAKAVVKGKGINLTLPTLPVALPLRVQLQSGNGGCWETTFSTSGVKVNDAARFNGRSE